MSVVSNLDRPAVRITLNRPERRNAMLLSMWQDIPRHFPAADQHTDSALITLRGARGHFGAGNDITDFLAQCADPASAYRYASAMAAAMRAVEQATKPVIAVIDGDCYGASVALTLACDLRVAADTATIAITPAKLGALYLASDLARLSALIGPARTRDMIFTARRLSAIEALDIGLIDRVLPTEDFEAKLDELLRTIAEGSPFTLRGTKQMLRTIGEGDAPIETEETLGRFVEATQGADFKEGARAFLEKRRPRFGSGN